MKYKYPWAFIASVFIALGHGCITVLLLGPMKIGGITGQSVEDVIAAGKSSYEAVKTLEQDTFNTDARKEKLQAMNSLMRGGYEGGEVTCNE
jgi:hypothetical protein